MDRRTVPLVVLVGAFTIATPGCGTAGRDGGGGAADEPGGRRDRGRACTEMGCGDQASIIMALNAAQAGPGSHEFTLDVDGKTSTCTIEFDPSATRVDGNCDDGLMLWIGAKMKGREERQGDVVMYSEAPIPGAFQWGLVIAGAPRSVRVVHVYAGQTLVDRSATFEYTPHAPNGEGCEPVCMQAHLDWP